MNYKNKYLKYKSKYLELKKLQQIGGVDVPPNPEGNNDNDDNDMDIPPPPPLRRMGAEDLRLGDEQEDANPQGNQLPPLQMPAEEQQNNN